MNDFNSVKASKERAQLERDRALAQVLRFVQLGQRDHVFPFLLANMARTPSLRKIRLWQLDALLFNTSRRRALKLVRKTREQIGDSSTIGDGVCNLGWATESREATVRLSAWLYNLMLREKLCRMELPDDYPYGFLYDTNEVEPHFKHETVHQQEEQVEGVEA